MATPDDLFEIYPAPFVVMGHNRETRYWRGFASRDDVDGFIADLERMRDEAFPVRTPPPSSTPPSLPREAAGV